MPNSKIKTVFFCSNCGGESPKWVGKCPYCGEWNTYLEEVVKKGEKTGMTGKNKGVGSLPVKINEIADRAEARLDMQDSELNRVLGNGLVPGSLVLIGGEPGIGKSTLMLQIALRIKNLKVLYVSGEESEQQLKMRAQRVGIDNNDCYILTETCSDDIFRHIESIKPDVVIIDSIQTLYTTSVDSSAGSISQIRETAGEMQRFCKSTAIPVFLIGHITKDGSLAGPKLLEHMVDTVLQFEGDRNHIYRILRSAKNRFGSTSEIGIYEMLDSGLRQVSNPSEVLISQREEDVSGISVASTIEGMRTMMLEIQALVSSAAYGTPQRSANGFDFKRLNMLLAVLEKRCGFRLGAKDVFLNIAGGIRVEDPAIDLAVVCSVLSSNEDIPIHRNICFAAEVGLSGEIRPVNRIEQRISEAEKLGFGEIIISHYSKTINTQKRSIRITPLRKVEQAFSLLFG